MIASTNPVSDTLRPSDIDRSGLKPHCHLMRNGQPIYYFVDDHLDLIRVDMVFEAGYAVQRKKMQALGAIQLISEGTRRHTAREIAEFLDFRGIILEKNNDALTSQLTAYTLKRYLGDLLPLLRELVEEATYPQEEFEIFVAKRRQQLLTNWQKTSYVARNFFWRNLYGEKHPLGNFALSSDLDLLTADDLRQFHREYLQLPAARLMVSGNVTDEVLQQMDDCFANVPWQAPIARHLEAPRDARVAGLCQYELPNAVQNTLRVGRLLPFRWDDPAYAQFMVLSTLLGGYFGSRLMSNLREDKGYTYGVNAMTLVCRDSLMFSIVTDVASDKASDAMSEILKELARLREELVPEEELQLVRTSMLGDFMRSIDGVFERTERYGQMCDACIDERFTDNFMAALSEESPYYVTPEVLRALAQQTLDTGDLLQISAGKPF